MFLIEAFEQLYQAYQRSSDRLEELRGNRTLFDLDRQILQHNLYGVDLNEEAIEIGRLSLWIKTAQRGKALTSLDHSIRVGNSVIADKAVHPRAFDWHAAFPEVFEKGGFDVVVGNPPYVRQEWIAPYKPYFQQTFKSYHGAADLYVYFYELGMRVLRPGGRLSFVVTNKWLKAAYGEPLRRFFAEETWVESVIDFGHAKQIFQDADVFPSIIVARKPTDAPDPATTRVCAIPRDELRINDLAVQIQNSGFDVERARLTAANWSLEPKAVEELVRKLEKVGRPLAAYTGARPRAGFATGLNEAFVIDTATRESLISADSKCTDILKPYLRGQDIDRWAPHRAGLWLIFARRGIDIDAYHAVKQHLERFRTLLEPKPLNWKGSEWPGRKPGSYKWFEIQDSVDYAELFSAPKIIYPDITWRASFCLDTRGAFGSKTLYFLPTDDLWLLAVLNSPLAWWFAWRKALHGKDEALRYHNPFMNGFPVPIPRDDQRAEATACVSRVAVITETHRATVRDLIDWLRVEHGVEKPTTRLSAPILLNSDSFIAEVRKVRGKKKPLSLASLRNLRDEYTNTIVPAQVLTREAASLEKRISDLVNAAYALTPTEVRLLWETAPPRMPIPAPDH